MEIKDEIDIQKNAEYFINQLAVLLRTAQLHSMNNFAFVSLVEKFIAFVTGLPENGKNRALELRGEYFYLNDFRIRYSQECIMNFDFLLREFRKAELGAIIFKHEITTEHMKMFVKAFIASSFMPHPFDSMKEELSSAGGIEIQKLKNIVDENTDMDAKRLIKKTYFAAVSYTKGVFQTVQNRNTVNVKKAKRVVASLVDHIVEHEQFVLGMTVIKDYDEYTFFHSTNVSILSIALGQKLGLSRTMLVELGMAALFHDIGKIDVPIEILNKPGSFDENEWRVMKNHPQWGVKALMKMRALDAITIKAVIVSFEHHMNYDLSGYPKQMTPLKPDLFSRIVTIADQYDAMTSARVYNKNPMSPEKALSIMMEKAGKGTDPLILKFFVNLIGIYPLGTLVVLDTNEVGIVFENNHLFLSRPRAMIISDNMGNYIQGHVEDLTKKNEKDEYERTITKAANPKEFNVNLADYFL